MGNEDPALQLRIDYQKMLPWMEAAVDTEY